MFGISGEHLLILGVVLLFFGPKRLPELGNTLGKAIRNFKDALAGVADAEYRKIDSPELKNPGDVAESSVQTDAVSPLKADQDESSGKSGSGSASA